METLSERCKVIHNNVSPILSYKNLTESNQYKKDHNPNGIINLGVAENHLCESELVKKLKSSQTWSHEFNYYPNSAGELVFRQQICSFFENMFCPMSTTLDPRRIVISSGASGIISLISFLIADAGDVFLISSPYYTAFDFDVGAMANNLIFKCPLLDQDTGEFRFSSEIFKQGYNEALCRGLRPRAIILINPQNPLGDVYDETTIQPVLKFAAEKQLHVIVDEIYALSVFDNERPFRSILNYPSLPDPLRTHFIWSFSKDFGLSGTRVGIVYTGSLEMCTIGTKLNFLMVPSTAVQYTLSSIVTDFEWMHAYIKLNQMRLKQKYHTVRKSIEQLGGGIQVRNAQAGLFLWINFRSILHRITFHEERRLFETMFAHGVYVTNGIAFGCSEPGWFRMVFSVDDEWIDEGIERMKKALHAYQTSSLLLDNSWINKEQIPSLL